MTWAEVRASWVPLQSQVHSYWGRLTHKDVAAIAGKRHRLIAFLRLRYEIDEEEAATQADTFVRTLQVLSL